MEELKTVKRPNKYKTILIISVIIAVFIIAGAIAAKKFSSGTPKTNTTKAPKTIQQLTKCMLDGKDYTGELANRHPLAVIVENHPDARPQYGLDKASIVYEAITEGGITRFLAIYGPQNTDRIGPIRSARLFFMDWLKEYDAFFAHAGGNEDALANIDKYAIKDIPHSNSYYWRDNSKKVASEHTLFSSTEKLYAYASSKKYDINSSNYTTMKFKVDGPAASTDQTININFSSASYNVSWIYDKANNVYLRSMAGSPHLDAKSNEQLKANNVIVQTVSRTLQPHGSYGDSNYVFQTIGTGKASIFRDGKEIKGTWKKDSLTSRTKFYDEAGAEIEFNPGSTWYEIVPPESSFSAS